MNSPQPPSAEAQASRRSVSALWVFLLFFVVYNANFRCIRFTDTAPARVFPFALLLDHSLYLNRWIEPYVAQAGGVNGVYFAARSDGHWMSAYPIVMPLLLAPLYTVPAWLVARQHPPLAPDDVVLVALMDVMEKFCACLIAALSAALFYLALKKIVSPHLSLLLTLVYGLASTTWSISAQGLWRHGFTQLCFALLIWALTRGPDNEGNALWAGMALAFAAANKPTDVVVVLPVALYFALKRRREFLRFSAPLVVLGSLALAYNFYFFGKMLGGYPSPIAETTQGLTLRPGNPPIWETTAGLLISPSRGLLIFMPWIVFSLWGAVRLWKQKKYAWGRYLIVGAAAVFLEHVFFGTWWGGWCFGPRYLGDLLPFLVFFLIPVWPRIRASRAVKIAAVAAFAVAVWIQVVGAFYYPNGSWDALPTNVDRDPKRFWDWKDTVIRRSWQAGPAKRDLIDSLYLAGTLLNKSAIPPPHSKIEKRGTPVRKSSWHGGAAFPASLSAVTIRPLASAAQSPPKSSASSGRNAGGRGLAN